MGLFNKLFHTNRAPPKNTLSNTMSFFSGSSVVGQNMTERTAMQDTAVYTCVRVLAEGLAKPPLHIYQYTSDGGKRRAINHPLYFLLHDVPNPEMTSFIFREITMNHLLLWGNACAQIIRNDRGKITGLYPLAPNRMGINRATNGEIYHTYTRNYDDYQAKNKSKQVILLPNGVLHTARLGLDGLIGYNPIAVVKNAIGLSMAARQYGATSFENDATPGGVLKHPNVVRDPERFRKSWQSQFSGSDNHSITVLEGGMTFYQLSIPPGQAQFLDTRKLQPDEAARIFRVPLHTVGDLNRSTFSNIERQSLGFVKYTLNPWCVRREQAMNQQPLSVDDQRRFFVEFNVDGLLHGDYESRVSGYAIGQRNGWLSANNIRELRNLNRIPADEGGDQYLISGNMLPLNQAGSFYDTQITKESGEPRE